MGAAQKARGINPFIGLSLPLYVCAPQDDNGCEFLIAVKRPTANERRPVIKIWMFDDSEPKEIMKTLIIAATTFIALSAQAFAGDTATVRNDSITVFPPMTQYLQYSYSQPLRQPVNSPAAGTLAETTPTTDRVVAQASTQTTH